MKKFQSIEKLDTAILYSLELASSISVLLLAFGLIASMANVLTKGSVLTNNLIMQRIWAWTQCIAIDASVAGTIIRTFHYCIEREKVRAALYGLLSLLLLFTAAIVSNNENPGLSNADAAGSGTKSGTYRGPTNTSVTNSHNSRSPYCANTAIARGRTQGEHSPGSQWK